MRLSEAIRLGATLKPQSFGSYYGPLRQSTCAIGAAFDALGEPITSEIDKWPVFAALHHVACPECHTQIDEREDWKHVITHLNDFHRWSRERIADFVELHEPLPVAEPDKECARQ